MEKTMWNPLNHQQMPPIPIAASKEILRRSKDLNPKRSCEEPETMTWRETVEMMFSWQESLCFLFSFQKHWFWPRTRWWFLGSSSDVRAHQVKTNLRFGLQCPQTSVLPNTGTSNIKQIIHQNLNVHHIITESSRKNHWKPISSSGVLTTSLTGRASHINGSRRTLQYRFSKCRAFV